MIWTFVFCLLKKTRWALLSLLPVSLGIPCELGMSMITGNRRRQRLHPWHLTLFHHCLFWNGSVVILIIIVAFYYCWKKVPTVSEKVPVLSSCSQEISSLSLGDVSYCLAEALAVHGIQSTVTNCCYFDGETCIFPLSASWQSGVSLGQTNKFLYSWWENTASANGSRRVPDEENLSLSTACWLLAARQARGEITGLYVRGFAAGSWFFCFIVLSTRFCVFAFPSSACVQLCKGLSPHLRKFCREVTAFTAGVNMEVVLGHQPSPDLKQKQ